MLALDSTAVSMNQQARFSAFAVHASLLPGFCRCPSGKKLKKRQQGEEASLLWLFCVSDEGGVESSFPTSRGRDSLPDFIGSIEYFLKYQNNNFWKMYLPFCLSFDIPILRCMRYHISHYKKFTLPY